MAAHGWLISSHRTWWWCGGGVITYPCVPRHSALRNDGHFNFRCNISVFSCNEHTGNFHEQPRNGWPEWHGWSGIFSSTCIDTICRHSPKILRGCNCVGMLYTCMAWIYNYIPHNTGIQGLFIFRWRPVGTSCNEEVTCSWLSEVVVTQMVCLFGATRWWRHSETLIIALCILVWEVVT